MPRINPRPIFRAAVEQLENARCPECRRAYDPVSALEDNCHHMLPHNCSWCLARASTVRDYKMWMQQEAVLRRDLMRRERREQQCGSR